MSVRAVLRILALVGTLAVTAPAALAQGFAGLGSSAEGYALPDRETRFIFPEDHGPHPDFRIEWWYLTANLTGTDGAAYGIQWTLFRNALAPGGAPEDQVWMAHAAISSPESFTCAAGSITAAAATTRPRAADRC